MPRQLTILFSWFIIINQRVLFTIHFEKSKLVLFQSILRLLEANDAQTFSRMSKVSMRTYCESERNRRFEVWW